MIIQVTHDVANRAPDCGTANINALIVPAIVESSCPPRSEYSRGKLLLVFAKALAVFYTYRSMSASLSHKFDSLTSRI